MLRSQCNLYHFFFWIVLVTSSLSIRAQTVDTLRYSVILNGNIAGFSKEWKNRDGSFQSYSWLNDRGRGDSLWVSWRENQRGFPVFVQARGHDYLKNPVAEDFELKDGTAHWKNQSEDQEKSVEGDAFYTGLQGAQGNLLKTLLRNNNKVRLLPAGNAELVIIKQHYVRGEALFLYAIKGMGFTPEYGWMDEDHRFFARVNDWVATIRKGSENLRGELLKEQKLEEEKFFRSLAKEAVAASPVVMIQDVNLFDAPNAQVIPFQNVLIKNGVINLITPTSFQPTGDVLIIDGRKLFLMPGLVDMHVHYSSDLDGLFHMANGVTSVRDLGGSFAVKEYKARIDRGEVIGPTIERAAGLIDGKGHFAGPTPALAGSAEEAVAWVDSFANRDYDHIKIYSSIKPEWVPAMVKRARERRMWVSGHIPAFMTAEQAVKAGYNEIQHMNMLFLNFFGDTIDTRSPQRFTIPGQRAATFDVMGKASQDFIRLLKEKKITVDPTLAVFEGMFTGRPGQPDPTMEAVIPRMPADVQRSLRAGGGGLPTTPETDAIYRASFGGFLRMLKALYDSGISIVAGTDGWAGFTLHRELELYARAGIPAEQVLKLATYHAAQVLGKQDQIGQIKVGLRANLILVEGDPTKNISDIRNLKWVIKDGKVYDPEKILSAVSVENYR